MAGGLPAACDTGVLEVRHCAQARRGYSHSEVVDATENRSPERAYPVLVIVVAGAHQA